MSDLETKFYPVIGQVKQHLYRGLERARLLRRQSRRRSARRSWSSACSLLRRRSDWPALVQAWADRPGLRVAARDHGSTVGDRRGNHQPRHAAQDAARGGSPGSRSRGWRNTSGGPRWMTFSPRIGAGSSSVCFPTRSSSDCRNAGPRPSPTCTRSRPTWYQPIDPSGYSTWHCSCRDLDRSVSTMNTHVPSMPRSTGMPSVVGPTGQGYSWSSGGFSAADPRAAASAAAAAARGNATGTQLCPKRGRS